MSVAQGADRLAAGLALLRVGQHASAERYFRALLADGEDDRLWFYIGAACHGLGRHGAAIEAFRRAAAMAPDSVEARCALATVLAERGESTAAETELRAALAVQPAHAQANFNLGVLLEQRGAAAEALERYGRAIGSESTHSGALGNRGALRMRNADARGALEDFDRIAVFQPASGENASNRNRALLLLHRDEEALAAAEDAIGLDPGSARAWTGKGIALASLGRIEAAQSALDRAREPDAKPPVRDALSVYVSRALERQAVCDWHDRSRLIETLRTALQDGRADALSEPGALIGALALPLTESELHALADAVAAAVRSRVAGVVFRPPALEAVTNRRIRVGFLSPEFRTHTGGFVMRRMFADRDRERFEYFAYALNPDDASALRRELRDSADRFVDVSTWSDADIAGRIRADSIDILLDRTGYFGGARPEVLALHPAPIQVGFLGTSCSLGEGLLDYRLSDAWTTPPESQPAWREKLVLLPLPHPVFETALRPRDSGSRSGHGLPDEGLVLCNFDLAHKIGPEVFSIWMRLLVRAPDAVLWLRDAGPLANANLRREALARGIAPERLRFAPAVPYEAHLACLGHVDLFLDTFHHNARLMAFNALWAGVPVVTYAGKKMASRLSGGFLRSLGLDELVLDSADDYERKALELVADPVALARVRNTLVAARGHAAAFDATARVRAVERGFIKMVERLRAGLPPATLSVD